VVLFFCHFSSDYGLVSVLSFFPEKICFEKKKSNKAKKISKNTSRSSSSSDGESLRPLTLEKRPSKAPSVTPPQNNNLTSSNNSLTRPISGPTTPTFRRNVDAGATSQLPKPSSLERLAEESEEGNDSNPIFSGRRTNVDAHRGVPPLTTPMQSFSRIIRTSLGNEGSQVPSSAFMSEKKVVMLGVPINTGPTYSGSDTMVTTIREAGLEQVIRSNGWALEDMGDMNLMELMAKYADQMTKKLQIHTRLVEPWRSYTTAHTRPPAGVPSCSP